MRQVEVEVGRPLNAVFALFYGSQVWYGGWTSFAKIILGKLGSISGDNAFIQSVFTVQV